MKKGISLIMAGVMAASTSIVAYADETDEALRSALSAVKQRVSVAEEISEFDYSVSTGGLTPQYVFTWHTPDDAKEYKSVYVTYSNGVITNYSYSSNRSSWSSSASLAKLTSAQLYGKARSAVKRLNPNLTSYLMVDRDSLSMSPYSNNATFSVYRTKNGVPVQNDRGSITLDKNTGELISFRINWHQKASFKSKNGALSVDEAWEKYGDMISLKPQYEISYDWEKKEYVTRLVYVQGDSGEINAFTGNKSDFVADGYFDTDGIWDEDNACEEEPANPETGGGKFTENELKELDKNLPFGTQQAAEKILKTNKYLTFDDDMKLDYDTLSKMVMGGTETYIYYANFSNNTKDEWDIEAPIEEPVVWAVDDEFFAVYDPMVEYVHKSVSLSINAETGEILSYNYYDSSDTAAESYDMKKADKTAQDVLNALSPKHSKAFTAHISNESSWQQYISKTQYKTFYEGSYHTFTREAYGIPVTGNNVNITFDGNMRLTNYSINYNEVEFADPSDMLRAEDILNKFRAENELNLYYKAGSSKTKTLTVLVYGTNRTVYADAFTGEPLYGYYSARENDLSGISDPTVLNKAKALNDNGIIISTEKFTENDAVKYNDLSSLISYIGRYPYSDNYDELTDRSVTVSRGEAMKIIASAAFGSRVAELKGIYKSPFSDIKDSDSNVGYYAIAYALGAAKGGKLIPDAAYTYGEMINFIYDSMA